MAARAEITTTAVDLGALVAEVSRPTHGAVATFVGQVRDHDPEASGEVVSLDYSAHPDAQRIMTDVVRQACEQVDPEDEVELVAVHRIGHLEVGDLALVVVAASAHRAPALDLCRAVVEAVKQGAPIWKKQHEADGSHTWSGLTC